MKLWIAIVVLMFATVGHAGKAEAGYYTGSVLLGFCESESVAVQNSCNSYLAGVADTTMAYDLWGLMNQPFCIPEDATLGQLRKVAIKGLNEKPEDLHMGASALVVLIYREAFPC
ncbi:Rap1a/Tai family immunity protein [Luminiphilus sp.]|nr:Rap1a/Tai family immunity protein [Luminiphilus sp.]